MGLILLWLVKFCVALFDGPDPAALAGLFHSLLPQASYLSLFFGKIAVTAILTQKSKYSQPTPSMATVRIPSSSTTATTLLGKGSTKTFSASHQPTQAQAQPILSSKPFHHLFFFPRPITYIAAAHLPPLMKHPLEVERKQPPKAFSRDGAFQNHQLRSALLGGAAGLGIALLLISGGGGAASAAELPSLLVSSSSSSLQLNEPENALSLPTWAIHVSSVVEWIAAMILVWQYGEKSGYESWKGLSWGMVPLLGGAFCACTWHFFYNSESLNILVALQAALTVIGNFTICIAAYRICKSSQEVSKDL